jgi:hypothetical protein
MCVRVCECVRVGWVGNGGQGRLGGGGRVPVLMGVIKAVQTPLVVAVHSPITLEATVQQQEYPFVTPPPPRCDVSLIRN